MSGWGDGGGEGEGPAVLRSAGQASHPLNSTSSSSSGRCPLPLVIIHAKAPGTPANASTALGGWADCQQMSWTPPLTQGHLHASF